MATDFRPLRRLRAWFLIVALLPVLLPGACSRGDETKGALTDKATGNRSAASAEASAAAAGDSAGTPAANGASPARSRTSVEVLRVAPQDFTVSGSYIGHLLPRERVDLRSEIEGVAERVLFDEGDFVKTGQLLANISTEQLRLRRDQAKADLTLAESTYARERELNAKKLLPDAQLEQSGTRRNLASLTLRLAEIELKKSRVTAPLNGTVKTRGVNVGEFLNKGQRIAEILDVRQVRALINVPEREVRFLKLGREVQVTFDGLPNHTFTGAVRLVGLEADLRTRTFPVEVELDNPQALLRPGMLARVEVPLQAYQEQLLVPRFAILERERGRFVYVAEDGTAREHEVETGASSGGKVQVLRGLKPGDQLIVVGQQKLTPGEPIEVRGAAR